MKITIELNSVDELFKLKNLLSKINPDITDMALTDIGLRGRTLNVLNAENITSVAQLIKNTESDLLRTPNVTRRTMDEIKTALANHGICLAPNAN